MMRQTLCICFIFAQGCGNPPLPLEKPLAAQYRVEGGLRIVVADSDLPTFAETVRIGAGKTIDVPGAPWTLPQTDDHKLGAWSTSLTLKHAAANWSAGQHLVLNFEIDKVVVPLALGVQGQPACKLTWSSSGGLLQLQVEVIRSLQGQLAATLAAEPSLVWQMPTLADTESCLKSEPEGTAKALQKHLEAMLRNQAANPLTKSTLNALAALFPPSLEFAAQFHVQAPWAHQVQARVSADFLHPAAGEQLAIHAGARTVASLAVGLDVDRAPTAVDAPLPSGAVASVAPQPPTAPVSKAFVRRALVVDGTAMARVGWAVARSGALARQTTKQFEHAFAPNWAAIAMPDLAPWVDGPPSGARLWPESSPEIKAVDTPSGPAAEWKFDKATLEILGRIGDMEVVVLRINGGFRARVRTAIVGGSNLQLEIVDVQSDDRHVLSPILAGNSSADSSAESRAILDQLVDSALRGIFQQTPVFPLNALLPKGTVATGLTRSGEAFWLWLDGAPPN